MIITQSNIFVGAFQFLIKILGDLDANMVSFDRVSKFEVTEEKDEKVAEIPENWLKSGNISFNSVSVRYSPEKKLVLNKITVKIDGGEKIGIVGRTGAGKSSLLSFPFV